MTVFKTTLLAATALTLLTGAALAGSNNETFIYQGDGAGRGVPVSGNSAVVLQTGDSNKAGSDAQNLLQNGADSAITVKQSGNSNMVGLDGVGVEQYGANNTLSVTQTSNGNNVGQVVQNGATGGAATRNVLTITQGGGGSNTVELVGQAKDRTGEKNNGTIQQTGKGNKVSGLIQYGAGNTATLTQSGVEGAVNVYQEGLGNTDTVTQAGTKNAAVSTTIGDGNTTTVRQDGKEASATVFTNGNKNTIDITQGLWGTKDVASVELYRSDSNSVYVSQFGTNTANITGADSSGNFVNATQILNNTLTLDLKNANSNTVDTYQWGKNSAKVTVSNGDSNYLGLSQNGLGNVLNISAEGYANSNDLISQQIGAKNVGNITFQGGDGNILRTFQGGSENQITALLKGSDNNASTSVDLGNASTFLSGYTKVTFTKGALVQRGYKNVVDLDVAGNSNAFATVQLGNSNTINAKIGGNGNAAAVAQMSNGNSATFQQNGNFNSVAVFQGNAN